MTHTPGYRRILHRMGYYDYQMGLAVRYLNQGEGWKAHSRRCRNFIMKVVEMNRPGRITVLGSGWLLEFPLAETAGTAEKIILADVIHPPEVVSQTAGISNIELLEADLTGGLIEELWEKTRKHGIFRRILSPGDINLHTFSIPGFDMPDPGLVISLNILTQLEVLPLKLLRRRLLLPDEDLEHFAGEIQRKHIEFLKKHNSVIITDISEMSLDKKGNSRESPTLRTALPEGRLREEWVWDFDLTGEDFRRKRTFLRVAAVML